MHWGLNMPRMDCPIEATVDHKTAREYCASVAKTQYTVSCHQIAFRILGTHDASNRVVQSVFSSIERMIDKDCPDNLEVFLWRKTRSIAIAQESSDGELGEVISEVKRYFCSTTENQTAMTYQKLCPFIRCFLDTIPGIKRTIFVLRYWHFFSISELAQQFDGFLNMLEVKPVDWRLFLEAIGYIKECWIYPLSPFRQRVYRIFASAYFRKI